MSDFIICTENLSSAYGDKVVLRDIYLQIPTGRITVILGTSGCGKTTLLKHFIGLKKPLSGSVELLGKDIDRLQEAEMVTLFKQVGVLFQNGALLNSLPVYENLAIPFEQHTNLPPDLIRHLIQMKLELVGLSQAYHLLPSELSGGMRKRAALARAIALDPVILFADEPAAGLDPVTSAALDDLLLSLKTQLKMTLVIVTHEVSSIKRIADYIIYLHEGRILYSGSLADALKSDLPPLRHFFNSALS